MTAPKILIADPLHPVFKELAEKMGYQVDDFPEFTRQQTIEALGGYTVLVIRTKFRIDKEVIDAGTHLKVIARAGAGTDNIDVEYAREKGISCIHASEGNRNAVGEHTLGMLLSLMNKLNKADREIRAGVWDREGNRGHELMGKTVAIIGYGNMGRSFAAKLGGMGVTVLAYDKYKTGFSDQYVQEASMEEVVRQADILSLHLPLTRETRHLVNGEFLFHFKKPVYFINTARGELADTNAIAAALGEGKLLGAALDVLETEKFPLLAGEPWFNQLKHSNKVLFSPHIAGWTVESYRGISEVLAAKLSGLGD